MEIFNSGQCFLWAISFIFFLSVNAQAQVIQAGVKGGYQLSWVNSDDKLKNEIFDVSPVHGFNAGGVLSFKVKERYFLHTEYIYSTKGKMVTIKENAPQLPFERNIEDKVRYSYAEVPVMFAIHFKGNLGKGKEFKWYVGAGPNFSYWLGGNGSITSDQIKYESIYAPELEYKIKFNETREDQSQPEVVYFNDVKRFQVGIGAAIGLVLEPAPRQSIMIDLRYEVGGTRLGKSTANTDFIFPSNYQDNLKARNHGFRASLIYLYEFSTDKKTRNKGKSTIKNNKRSTIRRR